MRYDCDIIRDIAPLYKDGVLSDRGMEIVGEHLSECAGCREFYDGYADEAGAVLKTALEGKKEVAFAKKIKAYRLWQASLFLFSLISLLAMTLPWFGIAGVTELAGTVILRHPGAIIGTGLFFFAIWYPFHKIPTRLRCGFTGWGLLLAAVIYDFLTLPLGSTTGIQLGLLHFEIPFFSGFDLSSCFQYTLAGFYIGIVMLLLEGVGFYLFVRKTEGRRQGSSQPLADR